MHHHPFYRLLVAPVAIVVLLAGCTSTQGGADDAGPATSIPAEGDSLRADRPSTDGESAVRSFRDPADDGFAPVDDAVIRPDLDDWALATPASGSGADAMPDRLAMVSTSPADLIAQIAAALAEAEPSVSSLDALEPIDVGDPGPVSRDGRRRNEAGEALTLDRLALDACGNVEIALTLAEREQDRALEHLVSASEQVRASGLPAANAWGSYLEDTVLRGTRADLAPLIAFLATCAAGGYEL